MQQKWWLIAAGVIGIGLAVLLFPRPDTGDAPPADPTNTHPLDFKGEKSADGATLAAGTARVEPPRSTRRASRPEARLGPNPVAAEIASKRSPEGIYAGRLSGPWTVVRRQLTLMKDDAEAQAFAAELEPLVTELRNLRRDPESGDYAQLEARQKELLVKARAHEAWMADATYAASIDRVEQIIAEYHENVAATDAANDAEE